jgi:uncharacterized membrane protein
MIVLIIAAVSAAFGLRKRIAVAGSGIVRTAHFAALLFGGLFGGLLLAVLVIELTLRGADASVYTQVRHVAFGGLGVPVSATLLPALVATVFLVIANRKRGRTFWLMLTALVLLVTAFAISLLINLPINTEQLAWVVQAPPVDWASVRDRWQLSHVARTVATVVALGFLGAAALQTSSPGHHESSTRVGVGARAQLSR